MKDNSKNVFTLKTRNALFLCNLTAVLNTIFLYNKGSNKWWIVFELFLLYLLLT